MQHYITFAVFLQVTSRWSPEDRGVCTNRSRQQGLLSRLKPGGVKEAEMTAVIEIIKNTIK